MSKEIETHGDALRLARRTMEDKRNELNALYYDAEDYSFGAGNQTRAAQILQNYDDALAAIGEMLEEEERWEVENGFSDENGNRVRGGQDNG